MGPHLWGVWLDGETDPLSFGSERWRLESVDVSLARGETWKKSCCGGKGGGGVVVVVGQFLFPSLKATLDINQTK